MNKKKAVIDHSNIRIVVLAAAFVFVSLIFIFRLFTIQVLHHEDYKVQAQDQYWNLQELPSKRGNILSADGYPLATTQVSYLLYVEPKVIENKTEVSSKLASKLAEFNKFEIDNPYDFHKQKLDEFFSRDLYWVKVISNLTPEEKNEIEGLNIKGIGFEEEPLRYYPEGKLASHVLGFVASDEKGKKQGYFGLEGSFNGDLDGKPGRIIEEQDALGAPILVGGYTRVDPIDGRDVVLTIDRGAQYIVERKLEAGVKKYDALSGTVIVMEPSSGNILAMANYPTYDPANFNDYGDPNLQQEGRRKQVERTNLGISQTYEPGSVIKALTVSTAVDLGKVVPETTFVDGGPVQYSDYVIDNWDGKHHGVQTIVQLLQKSNNIGAAWTGHLVGSENLSNYFQKFGLGKRTSVDLEGEDTGVIRPYKDWTDIDLATISFGQGISATPIQVLNAFNVIANGGILMQPRIVTKVVDEGEVIEIPVKEVDRVISSQTAETMVSMLTQAVAGGESKYFTIKTYDIAGKTGTAQIPFEGKYDPNKTNATFVGFLTNSKKFSMIVKLQEPESSIYAAETAVPLWMDIANDLVKYYGIPVDHVVEEPLPAPILELEESVDELVGNDANVEDAIVIESAD